MSEIKNHKINVEICQRLTNVASESDIIDAVTNFLLQHKFSSSLNSSLQEDSFLSKHVEHLSLWDSHENCLSVEPNSDIKSQNLNFYVFRLYEDENEQEMLDDENDDLPAAHHLLLPSRSFHNLWETLLYESDIKTNLLSYATTGLVFADKCINQNIITWNRVVLLHGPPGTGKTSLCQALAHKLAIRLSHRFSSASLLEVNSHSLFSKWFSESGKLVMKMFKKVEELVEDEHHLVCLLIDEVESLTAARSSVASGTEPSDAIRVVNALLTQIDRLKKYKNVLILATSNVTGKIDVAFIDRADIKFFIDLPSASAIYNIFRSCLEELKRVNIISPKDPIIQRNLGDGDVTASTGLLQHSHRLWEIANESIGLSGRTLRKLPFLAHAKFVHSTNCVTLSQFLEMLSDTVKLQFDERKHLSNS